MQDIYVVNTSDYDKYCNSPQCLAQFKSYCMYKRAVKICKKTGCWETSIKGSQYLVQRVIDKSSNEFYYFIVFDENKVYSNRHFRLDDIKVVSTGVLVEVCFVLDINKRISNCCHNQTTIENLQAKTLVRHQCKLYKAVDSEKYYYSVNSQGYYFAPLKAVHINTDKNNMAVGFVESFCHH